MAKQTKYRQCKLTKKQYGRTLVLVSWIPSNFAKVNKVLKLKRKEDWEDGWMVVSASENEVDERNLPDYHKSIKGHRKMTGDNMPKMKQT